MTDAKTQVDEAARLWASCADALRTQVNDATWLTWFDGVMALALTDDALRLGVPNPVVRERLDSRWTGLITECLRDISGQELRVTYEVVTPPSPLTTEVDLPREVRSDVGSTASSAKPDDLPSTRTRETVDAQLNPRYTFDAFVIGASNRFAHAAAQSVAENPAKSYNPLFIHGGAGLGKTHLLHAIGNYVREQFPSRHVRYVSTETFMNEFVDAIRTNSTTAFKRRYRECDVLLVDDIQFMETKEGQEEFFHTFNSLYGAGKQIVITSDRPPKAIATLEDRLRSRFLSGLITDVQPPELETRLAILRKKAEGERTSVPDDVLEFIATHVKDNIRELEGALIRVSAFASLNRLQLDAALAEVVLADLVAGDKARKITPRAILEATAKMYGFTIDELCGPSRRRPLVTARQVGMYVFRDLTDMSYPMIAREFGGRDHTTVIHAVEKITGLMREKRDIYDQVTELIHTIKAGG